MVDLFGALGEKLLESSMPRVTEVRREICRGLSEDQSPVMDRGLQSRVLDWFLET